MSTHGCETFPGLQLSGTLLFLSINATSVYLSGFDVFGV